MEILQNFYSCGQITITSINSEQKTKCANTKLLEHIWFVDDNKTKQKCVFVDT